MPPGRTTFPVASMVLFDSTSNTPPGYVPPESYELDENRDLMIAHLGLDDDELGMDLGGDVISIMPDVPLGEPSTETYEVEEDVGGGTIETVVQTVTINTFNLTIARDGETLTATWTFDFIVTRSATGGFFPDEATSQQYIGSRSGDVSGDGMQISWTSVEGIWQNCNLLDEQDPCRGVCVADMCVSGPNVGDDCTTNTDCDIPLTDTLFPPGTWTRD